MSEGADPIIDQRMRCQGYWKGDLMNLELTRFVGHLILGAAQGKEALDGSSSEVPRGVPA